MKVVDVDARLVFPSSCAFQTKQDAILYFSFIFFVSVHENVFAPVSLLAILFAHTRLICSTRFFHVYND